MKPALEQSLKRASLPAAVFSLVVLGHYLWFALFGPQVGWTPLDGQSVSNLRLYIEGQNYWLGSSYALSLAFAAVALRRYREQRFCNSTTLAVGGVTLSGFLAVAGCYLVGCCGSPMLAVYLSLFGAAFLPFAKPLVFVLTAVFISGAWLWMNHSQPVQA